MKTLLVVSDSHSNSIVGLSKPSVNLDDGSEIHASTVRRWLFHTWEDILKQVKNKQRGELYAVLNGDIIETDAKSRHATELLSANKETAVKQAIEVFEPLFEMCKGVYVVRGTEAHVGEQGQIEEIFAKNFDNTIRDDSGNASRWFLPLEFDGVKMDICHHPRGGSGGRPMNSQTGVDRIAADTMFMYANMRRAAPDLVIRSHLHGYRDSRDAFATRAIITPPMSLLTAYTYRLGITFSNDVGAILIYADNGKYFVEPLTYEVRKPEWIIQ